MTKEVDLTQALKKYFGFDHFKGDQEAIIRNLMAGNNTFVLMPTGGGKSLCYQLPSLIMEGTAIVVSPLIALMKNQVDVINGLTEEDGLAHFLNSSLNRAAINRVVDDVHSGRTKLLYVQLPQNLLIKRRTLSSSLLSISLSMPLMRHTVFRSGDMTSGLNTETYGLPSTALLRYSMSIPCPLLP